MKESHYTFSATDVEFSQERIDREAIEDGKSAWLNEDGHGYVRVALSEHIFKIYPRLRGAPKLPAREVCPMFYRVNGERVEVLCFKIDNNRFLEACRLVRKLVAMSEEHTRRVSRKRRTVYTWELDNKL